MGPFDTKGIGKYDLVPLVPAIANAIYEAIGIETREFPFAVKKIVKAIEDKGS